MNADAVLLVRAVTFGCAIVIALVIGKVLWQRVRGHREESGLGLVSYALAVIYIGVAQTYAGFRTPLSWLSVVGILALVVGAYAGVREVVVIRRRR